MHPIGALITGLVAGGCSSNCSTLTQNRWKIDDVLCGRCTACAGPGWHRGGIFGAKALGGMGGGLPDGAGHHRHAGRHRDCARRRLPRAAWALRATTAFASDEEEYEGADLTIHRITATADRETHW